MVAIACKLPCFHTPIRKFMDTKAKFRLSLQTIFLVQKMIQRQRQIQRPERKHHSISSEDGILDPPVRNSVRNSVRSSICSDISSYQVINSAITDAQKLLISKYSASKIKKVGIYVENETSKNRGAIESYYSMNTTDSLPESRSQFDFTDQLRPVVEFSEGEIEAGTSTRMITDTDSNTKIFKSTKPEKSSNLKSVEFVKSKHSLNSKSTKSEKSKSKLKSKRHRHRSHPKTDTAIGKEFEGIDINTRDKQLLDNIVDSLSRLALDVCSGNDNVKQQEGRKRLEEALRALDG